MNDKEKIAQLEADVASLRLERDRLLNDANKKTLEAEVNALSQENDVLREQLAAVGGKVALRQRMRDKGFTDEEIDRLKE
jgi:hypothetical protein